MKKVIKYIKGIGIIIISLFVIYIFKDPYILFGHKPYFYSCNSFLSVNDIDEWKKNNAELLKTISQYAVSIDFDYQTCPSSIGVIINYDSYYNRDIIIKLIGSHLLINGVPFKMYNI